MNEKIAVVITSIAGPNRVLQDLACGCQQRGYRFIVIGDQASPADFHIDGCDFYSLERQLDTGLKFAKICPTQHYARKNIGYLIAIADGASVIIETDDDNIPYETFWQQRRRNQSVKTAEDTGWVNIYRYFTDANIWPRGLPLEQTAKQPASFESLEVRDIDCPIQQGLADDNPDVDAVYRLTVSDSQTFRKDRRVAIAKDAWYPFNSQNTTWWRDVFALLYLLAYCSFRVTDIWRSFIAQRIAGANGWSILYHEPTVRQQRNQHDLMRDFEDEIPGYLNNSRILPELEKLTLESGVDKIVAGMRLCYERLVAMGLVGPQELDLLDAWSEDFERLTGRW